MLEQKLSSIKNDNYQLILLLTLYFVYLLFGAAVISLIECNYEEELCRKNIAEWKHYNLTKKGKNFCIYNGNLSDFVEV